MSTTKVMMKKNKDWQGYWIINEDGECVAKTCSLCTEELPIGMFGVQPKMKYGVASRCRECNKKYLKAWQNEITDSGNTRNHESHKKNSAKNSSRTDEQIAKKRAKLHPDGIKSCRKCKEDLKLDKFSNCRSNPDGLQKICSLCSTEECAEYYNRPGANEGITLGAEMKRAVYRRNSTRSLEEVEADQRRIHPDGVKVCTRCRKEKTVSEFYGNICEGSGLHSLCKSCTNSRPAERFIEYWVSQNIALECYVCTSPWVPGFHADHVIPARLGGSDDRSNRLPICPSHNSSKWTAPLEIWLRESSIRNAESVWERLNSYGVNPNVPVGEYDGVQVYRDDEGLLQWCGLDRGGSGMVRSRHLKQSEEETE